MVDRYAVTAKIIKQLSGLPPHERQAAVIAICEIAGIVPDIIRRYEAERRAKNRKIVPDRSGGFVPDMHSVVPVVTASSPNGNYRSEAIQLLNFLNEKTGKTYRAVESNLRLIESRLQSGASFQDVKGVIVRKIREWNSDEKMAKFLRPMTLFRASNFEQYLGERDAE